MSSVRGRIAVVMATMSATEATVRDVGEVATDAAARAGAAAGLAQEQHAAMDALANTAQELARLAERLRGSSSHFVTAAA